MEGPGRPGAWRGNLRHPSFRTVRRHSAHHKRLNHRSHPQRHRDTTTAHIHNRAATQPPLTSTAGLRHNHRHSLSALQQQGVLLGATSATAVKCRKEHAHVSLAPHNEESGSPPAPHNEESGSRSAPHKGSPEVDQLHTKRSPEADQLHKIIDDVVQKQ